SVPSRRRLSPDAFVPVQAKKRRAPSATDTPSRAPRPVTNGERKVRNRVLLTRIVPGVVFTELWGGRARQRRGSPRAPGRRCLLHRSGPGSTRSCEGK